MKMFRTPEIEQYQKISEGPKQWFNVYGMQRVNDVEKYLYAVTVCGKLERNAFPLRANALTIGWEPCSKVTLFCVVEKPASTFRRI